MPRLADVLDMARYESIPRKDNTQDIAAVILASQTAMADVITRNFKGEIKDQVCAECASITSTLENALRAFVRAEIAALPVPERVIVERTVETVTEREEREEREEEDVAHGPRLSARPPARAMLPPMSLSWLLLLPARLIDQDGVRRPWWRNARFWAVLVTIAQIGVYVVWG